MTPIRVVVADDEPWRVEEMRSRIERAAGDALEGEVKGLHGDSLRAALQELKERADRTAEDPDWHPRRYEACFDSAHVLVLDYDLRRLLDEHAYLTGEDVARLARSYSKVGPIVSVNQFGGPRFDLRTTTAMDGWADVLVSHQDLANPGLWRLDVNGQWGGYRPWRWPVLSELVASFEKRVDIALRRPTDTIREILGIPSSVVRALPSEVVDPVVDIDRLSLEEIAERLFGRAPLPSRPVRMRAVAAKVGRWLNFVVLPRQDVLIDAPHLATLFPSVIEGNPTKETLDRLCKLTPTDLPLQEDMIDTCSFRQASWLDRPAWWTEEILENQQLLENREPWNRTEIDSVFAEDMSAFQDPADCHPYRAEGLIKRRFVRMPDGARDAGVVYEPQSRLIQ